MSEFQYLNDILLQHIKRMKKTAFGRYEEIVANTLKYASAKLHKSFKIAFTQMVILCMLILEPV